MTWRIETNICFNVPAFRPAPRATSRLEGRWALCFRWTCRLPLGKSWRQRIGS